MNFCSWISRFLLLFPRNASPIDISPFLRNVIDIFLSELDKLLNYFRPYGSTQSHSFMNFYTHFLKFLTSETKVKIWKLLRTQLTIKRSSNIIYGDSPACSFLSSSFPAIGKPFCQKEVRVYFNSMLWPNVLLSTYRVPRRFRTYERRKMALTLRKLAISKN